METEGKIVVSRLKGFIPVTFISIILFLVQWWAQMKGFITQDNADIILYVAIIIFFLGLLYMLWPWLKVNLAWQKIKRIRMRSPVYFIPGQGHKDIASLFKLELDYKIEYEQLKEQFEDLKRQTMNPVLQSVVQPQSPKMVTVLKAIDEARGIISKGKDVPVYITDANGLKPMYAQEILDILIKLQEDDKVIKLISFPKWLLPPKGEVSQSHIIDTVSAAMDKSLNHFVVQILDGFNRLI